MHVAVSDGMLSRTRYCLREMLPGIGASHIAEALACGLGFSTNLALLAWLESRLDPGEPRLLEMPAFSARLVGLGHPGRVEGVLDHGNLIDIGPRMPLDAFRAPSADGVRFAIMAHFVAHEAPSIQEPRWTGLMDRMLSASLPVLELLSLRGEAAFTPEGVSRHLDFLRLRALSQPGSGFPEQLRSGLLAYIAELPDYEDIRWRQAVLDRHGYAHMQVYRVLSGACGHGRLSEGVAAFADRAVRRRLELVMLPPGGILGELRHLERSVEGLDAKYEVWGWVPAGRPHLACTEASFPLGFASAPGG